jgi:hypothetical protein
VGSQVIAAGNSGSFSVTVTPGHDSGTWDATLRVDLRGGSPLTLTFPSGQEYDLRLRDSDGTTLWTWSADKVFPQVVHQRDVSRYSATVADERKGWTAVCRRCDNRDAAADEQRRPARPPDWLSSQLRSR